MIEQPMVLVMGAIQDYRDALHEREAAEMDGMATGRQLGFASGRYCAHKAQVLLGGRGRAVTRDGRVPAWPEGITGSITHSTSLAAAVVSDRHAGVGVDLERTDRLEQKLYNHLFTEAEQARIERDPNEHAATLMFSAKEAGYKATYTIGQNFFGFHDAEIDLHADGTFAFNYIGTNPVNRIASSGFGYWSVHAGHVLTLFAIPSRETH